MYRSSYSPCFFNKAIILTPPPRGLRSPRPHFTPGSPAPTRQMRARWGPRHALGLPSFARCAGSDFSCLPPAGGDIKTGRNPVGGQICRACRIWPASRRARMTGWARGCAFWVPQGLAGLHRVPPGRDPFFHPYPGFRLRCAAAPSGARNLGVPPALALSARQPLVIPRAASPSTERARRSGGPRYSAKRFHPLWRAVYGPWALRMTHSM
jgi:hypothetical protein